MGYDMQEGVIVRWLKAEGDAVRIGEPIAEIETDKAVVEFESYADGVLQKILVSEGYTVPVGQPIAIIATEVEAAASPMEQPAVAAMSAPSAEAVVASPTPEAIPAVESPVFTQPAAAAQSLFASPPMGVRASPMARRLASQRGIDLSQVEGTGPGGRITRSDVLTFGTEMVATEPPPGSSASEEEPEAVVAVVEAEPKMAEEVAAEVVAETELEMAKEVVAEVEPEMETAEADAPEVEMEPATALALPPSTEAGTDNVIPLSRMRKQIARVTVLSKQEKPHFYVASDIDMTSAMLLRRQINDALESEGVRVTVNDLVVKACVEALKMYPKFNAFFAENGIQMNDEINLGIAIAEEEGLIVPAIMDCGSKSLRELAAASKDLAARAQSGTLRPQEYTGGTFAISNLGMFDVSSFVAIIHPPHTAVLAVGTVAKKPVVRDDEIVIAQMMTATLSADHRVVDGAEGASFIIEVKRRLENPLSLLV